MELTDFFLERIEKVLKRIEPVIDYAQTSATILKSDRIDEFKEIRLEVKDILQDYALLHGITPADLAEEKYN